MITLCYIVWYVVSSSYGVFEGVGVRVDIAEAVVSLGCPSG